MLDEKPPMTLQYRLRRSMLEKITSGEWKSGERIPSEREICDMYNVSRMTVREVTGALESEGYLLRKQGRGTFVSEPSSKDIDKGGIYSFGAEMEKSGAAQRIKVIKLSTIPISRRIEAKLGPDDSGMMIDIARLRYINGELFAYERSYVRRSVAPELSKEDIEKHGLYKAIQTHSGLEVDMAEQEFAALNCPADLAEYLGINKGDAALLLTRLSKSGGEVMEFTESVIRTDFQKYKVILK